MAYIKPAKPEHVYVKVTSDFDSSVWVGGTVVAFCPAARTFVSNGMKQIGKAAAVAA